MATFTAFKCDRCRHIMEADKMVPVKVGAVERELCEGCADKVQQVLDGAAIEIPP